MKIKRPIAVLLLVLLFVPTAACSGESAEPITWANYSDSSLGISIQYPQDWDVSKENDNELFFYSPWIGNHYAHVWISKSYHDQPVVLEDLFDESYAAISQGNTFSFVESSATTVNGMPAYELIWTNNICTNLYCTDEKNKNMRIFTSKGCTSYVITYWAHESIYSDYLETAQQMIDSLVIY